ncbi:hypothetical protein ERJ75_001000700 [Trypanosoma vivax]|uniref:Uncharacterized protein n=1 Tax=Trypanosoma vivax (strain Y486) TaxID=1055687 RepID=G0UAW5_TRYVY|nr:hypothetical protein TRVL_00977 [Trypanosoma vivax]KAH8611841.1 hypothetical protein ERJ75_001000700 [Trypanosoma vivax]CCC52952.1 conserved hypothetical protein [Trypanosoma vivax Y486]
MSVPLIPELSLGSVETGGGWGVGEQFARLPPAAVQAKSRAQLYTVAPEREGSVPHDIDGSLSNESEVSTNISISTTEHSGTLSANGIDEDGGENNCSMCSSELSLRPVSSTAAGDSAREQIPTTHYAAVSIEDDETFVDHGSAAKSTAVASCAAANTSVVGSMMKQTPQAPVSQHLKFFRPVSRLVLKQNIRAMVVAPDNASLLVAVDDDPVTLFDFRGVELNPNREMDVTHVHSMAVVRVPAPRLVTFKSSSPKHRTGRSVSVSASATKAQVDSSTELEETYALWCGVSRGSIVIVDLLDYSVSGVLRNAHTQTITGVWYLSYGKVLTAGNDKALKLWDPQARRCIKSRNIATIVSELTYVSSCKQIWAISDDNYIRVFDLNGNNVRVAVQSSDKSENAIRMKNEMRSIRYYESGDLVFVAMTRSLAVINPVTCTVLTDINVSITTLTFLESKAIVTGYGGLLQCKKESIGLLDLSDPLAPSLLYRGAGLDGSVTPVGLRLLTALPFVITAEQEGRTNRYLSVFNYDHSKEFCKGGALAAVPQQRKVTVEVPAVRRAHVVSQQGVVTSAHTAGVAPSSLASSQHPVVFATDRRGVLTREESSMNVLSPQRASVVLNSRIETAFYGGTQTYNNNYASQARSPNNGSLFHRSGDRGQSMHSMTSPELMASLSNIEKKTEDIRALFTHARVSRPLLDDLSKIHSLVSTLAINDQLGPMLDESKVEAIEQEFHTQEGRVIAIAIERLRLSAATAQVGPGTPRYSRIRNVGSRSSCRLPSSAAVGSGNTTPSPREAEKGRCSMGELSNSDYRTEMGPSVGHSDIPSESLLQWVAQLTRSGQSERESHRRQLDSLQQHNTRIIERNTAFINGIARMEQSLRTHAQRLLEEVDAAVTQSVDSNWDSSNQVYNQRHLKLLSQALQQVEQISVSSTPKEVTNAVTSLIALNTRLLNAVQYVHNDVGRSTQQCKAAKRAQKDGSGNESPNTSNSDCVNISINIASGSDIKATGGCLSPSFASPRPSAIKVVATHPQRIVALVTGEVASVEKFIKDSGRFWSCLIETQKVIYLPYEGGGVPNLFEDFMQYAVLWHLRKSQVMVDVCRKESVMVMTEALLSEIVIEGKAVEGGIGQGGSGNAHLTKKQKSVGCERGVGGGNKDLTLLSHDEVLQCDTARLVSVSLELESVASRMRDSFSEPSMSPPAGIAKEAVGGLFLIPSEKFHLHLGKLHGLLYWSRVTMHLLYECLECLSELVFHNDKQPRSFHKDNFKAIEQQVDDWRVFLEDLHSESSQLRSVVVCCLREKSFTQSNSTSPAAGCSRGNHYSARLHVGTSSTDDMSLADVELTTQWVVLFGVYVCRLASGDTAPALFASHDPNAAVSAADLGVVALLDEIAESLEAVRSKAAALLRYCQKVQSRLARVVEEAVVMEESGRVLIPMWRGGPIAERYCKGFCHDMS